MEDIKCEFWLTIQFGPTNLGDKLALFEGIEDFESMEKVLL